MKEFENMEVSGLAQRFVAAIIDQIIIAAATLLLLVLGVGSIVGVNIMSEGGVSDFSNVMGILTLMLLSWILWIIYYTLLEGRDGQTIGKKVMKIRVIKSDGRDVDYLSAFVRNLCRIIDQLPTLYLLGILLILVTKEKQRLGDMVAGTLVVTE